MSKFVLSSDGFLGVVDTNKAVKQFLLQRVDKINLSYDPDDSIKEPESSSKDYRLSYKDVSYKT